MYASRLCKDYLGLSVSSVASGWPSRFCSINSAAYLLLILVSLDYNLLGFGYVRRGHRGLAGSFSMRKVRHLTLVASAISIGAGLAGTSVGAKPQLELLKFSGSSKAEASQTVVGSAELDRSNQKVEALRKRTEQARQQLEAAKAHLRAAEAEYKAARAEKEALLLRTKATELASTANDPTLNAAAEVKTDASSSEAVSAGAPVPNSNSLNAGRIDPYGASPAVQPATLNDLGNLSQ